MRWGTHLIHALALGFWPALQGARHQSFKYMAIYVVVFAIGIYITGPKRAEVVHAPSPALLFVFALILSAVGCSISYLLGRVIFG